MMEIRRSGWHKKQGMPGWLETGQASL